MASATRLLAQARATARTAFGRPMAAATSPYVRVSPYGMSASAGPQAHPHFAEAARVRVLARRHADDPLEIALQVIGTAAETTRERRERRVAIHVGEIHTGAPYFLDPWIGGRLVGTAPATRAETGCARVDGGGEKRDAIPARAPARTRRT